MKLSELIGCVPGARLLCGAADSTEVLDICIDSRKVRGGALFAALGGSRQDGHVFVNDAVRRKAAAVAVENPIFASADVPSVLIPDMRRNLPLLASALFDRPSRAMELVGVTGTNGKTTTAFLVRSVLESARFSCGLLGTVSYLIGDRRIPASLTTPEISDTSRMLREMIDCGQRHCVMEVSSHALCGDRVAGLDFRAAVFTNLTQDHLDFHADMESYFLAKKKLFDMLSSRPDAFAAINIDDSFGRRLAAEINVPTITFSARGPADVSAVAVEAEPGRIMVKVSTAAGGFDVVSGLSGDFNVYNILAACACCLGLGVESEDIARGIESAGPVEGRMEFVPAAGGVSVLVDYAHTPDALRVALESLRAFKPRRIITVFGCGGERDRTKRPVMGRIAAELSDMVIITNDNPRDEDPAVIVEDILAGVNEGERFRVEKDRRRAIALALSLAGAGDCVLVAGKGHESYQVLGKRVLYFNDRQVCEELISQTCAASSC